MNDSAQHPKLLQDQLDELKRRLNNLLEQVKGVASSVTIGFIEEDYTVERKRLIEDFYSGIRAFRRVDGEEYRDGDLIYIDAEGFGRVVKPDVPVNNIVGVALDSGRFVTVATRVVMTGDMPDSPIYFRSGDKPEGEVHFVSGGQVRSISDGYNWNGVSIDDEAEGGAE